MRTRGLLGTVLALVLAGSLVAKGPQAQCGTYTSRTQQEAFLHWRSTVQRARGRLQGQAQAAAALPIARLDRDVGDIAVIDSSGGVVAERNFFNLDSRTVSFTQGDGGYTPALGDDSFDGTAALAGTHLDLADDDATRISLPFPFPFYGATYSEAWVNSNGSLTFTRGETSYDSLYGHFTSGPPAIAGVFTDLDPSASNDGVHVVSESGRVVVTWNAVPPAGSSFGVLDTFQIRLFPDGHVDLAFRTADPDEGVTGITPGGDQPVTLVDFAGGAAGTFSSGVAELFSSATQVDLVTAARRFYQTHDDAYDYLVFFNTMGVSAGSGIVAYELTTRSHGDGYGDIPTETGSAYGSPRRLQAVINFGPTSQYPADPLAPVPSRGVVGDTTLSVMGHETGHLWLALVSVPNPYNSFATPPMLGAGLAHWAFPFNSDASFLEGNRIADQGNSTSPRYRTIATVQHYSSLDQYLMGFRDPRDVEPTFAVLGSGMSNSRAPQSGINFNGTRLDISINDVIQAAGRRSPDATVAQRHFRMGVIVIVPENADLSAGSQASRGIGQVQRYRNDFSDFFAEATGFNATMDTTLRRGVDLSLFPNSGLVLGAGGQASITVAAPVASPLTFNIETPQSVLQAPASVTIPAGSSSVTFPVSGTRVGVEEFAAVPSDTAYHRAAARVQVNQASALRARVVSGDQQEPVDGTLTDPVVFAVVDQNKVPYSGVTVRAVASAGGRVDPESAVTDPFGQASFRWTPAPGGTNALVATAEGAPSSAATAIALGAPEIAAAVNAASFQAKVAPGGFVTLFGGSLAGGASASFSAPFPVTQAGVHVRVNGIDAKLLYLANFQLNFLAPDNILPGPAEVVVETPLGTSVPFQVQVEAVAPGVFYDPVSGYGAILISGTSTPTQSRAAVAGEFIEVYCTGLGDSPTVTATIAGAPATVTFAGATTIEGLQQVNVQIPAGLAAGAQDLALTVNGVASNVVKVQTAGR